MEAAAYKLANNVFLVFFVPYQPFAEVSSIAASYPNWYFKNGMGQPLLTNYTNGTSSQFLLINTTM